MKNLQDWSKNLIIEPKFLQVEEDVKNGRIKNYNQLDPVVFSMHGWDLISHHRLFKIMLPFLQHQLERAKSCMPELYRHSLGEIKAHEIQSEEDWYKVPVLIKDDSLELGLEGFRNIVNDSPHLLKPNDIVSAWIPFGSGGSMGKYTPTFVTLHDREREIQGWRRGHDYHGLEPGDIALFTYNTTHKRGQWMEESLLKHGVNTLIRRPEEDPSRVIENIRDYHANVLFTVQQPYTSMSKQAKAAGINLHILVMESLANPNYRGILLPDDKGSQ
jgi:phenylacetate-CoA ligase